MNTRFLRTRRLGLSSILASLALVLFSGPIFGQQANTTPDLEGLRTYIESARKTWQVPGLAVAIVKDDQVVLAEGFGTRSVESPEPVDNETLFAIASNTKAFTSASLAILVDEGKLNWDDRVEEYLPWLELKDPLTRDLRIRDLLCHRSGLGTFSGDLLWWGTAYSPQEVLERAQVLEPAGPFRARYGYSNLMFLAAGLVIEEVSGQPWGDFVKGRILTPLGMDRSVTSTDALVDMTNVATPHKTLLEGPAEPGNLVSQPIAWTNWDTMAAAGGIISSVQDMSAWLRLQLRRGKLTGEGSLFSEAQSAEMWKAHMPIPVSDSYRKKYPSTHFRSYALGWSMYDYLGKKVVGHGGGYDGMYSQVVMVPEENLGIVVLTNSMTGISPVVSYRILDMYLGGPKRDWSATNLPGFLNGRKDFQDTITDTMTPVVSNTKPSHPLEDYALHFRCPMYGDAKVEQQGDQLILRLLPNPNLVADLTHLHYDTFAIRWRNESAWFGGGTAHFVQDSRGEFVKLELDVPNDDLWFYELQLARVPDSE